jgi:arylsulfatase A-like enzyme
LVKAASMFRAREATNETTRAARAGAVRALALVLLLSGGVVGCDRAAHPPEQRNSFFRLVDQQSGAAEYSLTIQGTEKRVLDPSKDTQVFRLPHAPPGATLAFSVGVDPPASGGAVLFEIALQPTDGAPVQIYHRQVTTAGWFDERIEMPSVGSRKEKLVFKKTVLSGGPQTTSKSAWGTPDLITGHEEKKTSVILISIDTLRADRLGLYNSHVTQTPRFDAFGHDGVVYEQAFSPSTWTAPSHASLLFGVPASALPGTALGHYRPPTSSPALALLLRNAGYLTAAFTGGGFVSPIYGFAQGFDTYFSFQQPPQETPPRCTPERFDGATVFAKATKWLQQHSKAPFFLFVHTYDVHDRCPFKLGQPMLPIPDRGPDARREVVDYYADLVAKTDRLFGSFLDDLDKMGLGRDTLVMVVSDHGDAFWEHGFQDHGCGLKPYEELIKVPLMIRWPAAVPQGRQVADPVSLVAVAPTILEALRMPKASGMPQSPLPGLNLHDGRAPEEVFVYCDGALAVRTSQYKLITSRGHSFPDEVYDLIKDPGEMQNIVASVPAVEETYRGYAAQYWNVTPSQKSAAKGAAKIDDATRERLRALGYLQ